LIKYYFLLFILLIPWLLYATGEFPFRKKQGLRYRIKCYGITVGKASLDISRDENTLKFILNAHSTGLAELLVPFSIKCISRFDIKNNKFIEYNHTVRFKKERENYIISRVGNTIGVYYLLKPENKLIRKHTGLISREKSRDGLIALRVRLITYAKEVYDPLSLLYGFSKMSKNITLVSNNRINFIKSSIEDHNSYNKIIPALDLPGILPKGSSGYIKVNKDFPNIPFEFKINAPGIGKFYIYRTR